MKPRNVLALLGVLGWTALAATAGASGELGGSDWMRAKNSAQRAVVLGDHVYHLASHTQIRGANGETLTLADLSRVPDLESFEKLPRVPKLWVDFDATRVGGRLILNWVQISWDQEGLDPMQNPKSRDARARVSGSH